MHEEFSTVKSGDQGIFRSDEPVPECWVPQERLKLGAGGQCVKADRNDLEIRSAEVCDSSGVKTLLSTSTAPTLECCE